MNRWHRWLRAESGATTAEYAVILMLIAAALVLASDAVRLAADGVFRRVAFAPAGAAAPAAQATPPADSVAPWQMPRGIAPLPPLHAVAWVLLAFAATIVGYSRYRQVRARGAVRELDCSPETTSCDLASGNVAKRQEVQRVLLRHFDEVIKSHIEVRHVMSRNVRAVAPDMPLADLREVLMHERFHHLLVLQGQKLLGVISDRDLASRNGRRAKDVMTSQVLTVAPSTQVVQAISMMLQRRISCLPVVEEGQVRGILTVTDILMTLQCLLQLLNRHESGLMPVEPPPSRTITAAAAAVPRPLNA